MSYLHHDQQGSTRLLSGEDGSVEAKTSYDAYGNLTAHSGSAQSPLGYDGQYTDADTVLTGSAGTVTGKCTYGAYGTPTCEGASTAPLGFDGQYTSSDTGLIYMRARVYDPSTAQFLSVDPMVGKTHAPYYYAGDNSLNEADPTGLGNWLNLGIPSPGEVVETLNPVKYYEEEIKSYENGCGYFASVAHGLEGAVVGALDASGVGEGEAALGEEGGTAIEDALAGLTPGNNPGVYTVDSPEELQQIYDELSTGGKPTGSSYPGQEVELPDGTRVGLRETLRTGGPTIDNNGNGYWADSTGGRNGLLLKGS